MEVIVLADAEEIGCLAADAIGAAGVSSALTSSESSRATFLMIAEARSTTRSRSSARGSQSGPILRYPSSVSDGS